MPLLGADFNQTTRSLQNSSAINISQKNIRLYPNPNDGNMILEYQLSENENGVLIISDITGKLIRSYNLSNNDSQMNIDASMLNSGLYLYNVFINSVKVKTDKLIITR